MKISDKKLEQIDRIVLGKKRANPVHGNVVGIGVHTDNVLDETKVFINQRVICSIEDLSRLIVELQMVKEAIEESTGLIL